jgi:small GTP-binding protein
LILWHTKDWKLIKEIRQVNSPSDYCFIWSPTGEIIAYPFGSSITILDVRTGKPISTLEGHTSGINFLSFSYDGDLLASKSKDNSIRIWRSDTWETIAIIPENSGYYWACGGIEFHPRLPRLATFGESNTIIRIWDINYEILLSDMPAIKSVRYTTAKLVLVGDSGVGKTGLGWRLAYNEFKEHSSTHGQQFWVIPELGLKREDGTECEAVLWDLAGQPDYRLVHSLFLDDVDTALVLFDPTNRQEPLSGVDFWLNQLKRKEKDLCNSILIGARTDRGTSTLTDEEIQAYCERNGICGGYIPTSALNGEGLPELLERLKTQIPWDDMTATVTTVTFKRIKDYVLALKEKSDRKGVLVSPAELRAQLQVTDADWSFSDAEMMTAVGHLANHGYVTVLRGSNGDQSILLAPDLLANLASSIVLEARRNPRGLGVLEESRLLAGDYHFLELHDLSQDESETLLDAAAVLFLEHNLCFRETFNQQTFLVFPSLINEKRPLDESLKTVEGASYRARGAVENVYASLVVLLGYTNTFIRTHQWQNQAQYEMGEGEICGFQQTDNRDGEIELVLYYAEDTPESVRTAFRGLFERFLSRQELEISRYQPVQCYQCGAFLARNVILDQLKKGKNFSFCHECGERVSLPDPEPVTRLTRREEVIIAVQQVVAQRRTAFEAALVRVKALLRDREEERKPTCFISYAWGVPEHERWVLQLAKDLRNAGVDVLLDRWHSPPGSNLDLYIDRILSSDFVIPVGTSKLREKYDTQTADPVVAAELKLINLRVRQPTAYGETVLPVLLAGDARTSFSPQLQPLVSVDFRETEFYFQKLFDMIWRLYDLPFDNPLLEELQESMSPQQV